jgi:acyl carrier protein
MTEHLSSADLARAGRLGFSLIQPRLGLELFDRACALREPLLAPLSLDRSALRARASSEGLPSVLRGLVPVLMRRTGQSQGLAARLAGVPVSERYERVLELVNIHVAAVLGHSSMEAFEPETAFGDLGFDSLAAVELRNRLNVVTELRLPPTLVFDFPSAATLAEHLLTLVDAELDGASTSSDSEAEAILTRLGALLPSIREDGLARDLVGARLRSLLAALDGEKVDDGGEDLASMSHEEVFELIDKEFGAS